MGNGIDRRQDQIGGNDRARPVFARKGNRKLVGQRNALKDAFYTMKAVRTLFKHPKVNIYFTRRGHPNFINHDLGLHYTKKSYFVKAFHG
jgi:hypothetical protein